MRSLVVLIGLLALAHSKTLDVFSPEQTSAFGYLTKVGIPRAEQLRIAEEKYMNSPAASRIINGKPAEEGQIPFQVGLFTDIIGLENGRGVCGGSLVSKNRVFTAGHCWFDGINQAWRVTVIIGSLLLNYPTGPVLETSVVVTHPQWTPTLVRNDVAVIYLPSDVTFSDTIAPVALPSGDELNEDFVNEEATVSGFGLTSDNGGIEAGQFVSQVNLQIISNAVCRTAQLINLLLVQDSNICTSGEGGNGPCQGDSGGPLFVTRDDKKILIGVVSFGSALGCESNAPAVYARTTSFMDFFNQHIEQ